MASKPIYELDGARFSTLGGFFREVSGRIIPGQHWGHNLDAFNDILRGGFGTPDGGFIIVWKNSEQSRVRLGYKQTLRHLRIQQFMSMGMNWKYFQDEIEKTRRNNGPTIFDWIVDIIERHGPDGEESEDDIELSLE